MTIAFLIPLTTKLSADQKNALIDPSGHVINHVEGSEFLPSPRENKNMNHAKTGNKCKSKNALLNVLNVEKTAQADTSA